MMRWARSNRAHRRALPMADRHYNRQKVGSNQFVPPGRCFVLLTECERALWVSSWPFAKYTKHRWAGAWVNSLFRNEGAGLASELILEAVSATRWHWPKIPDLGMITFVDPDEVKPKRNPGYCYLMAGFEYVGKTDGGLLAFQLLPEKMPAPELPIGATDCLWGVA